LSGIILFLNACTLSRTPSVVGVAGVGGVAAFTTSSSVNIPNSFCFCCVFAFTLSAAAIRSSLGIPALIASNARTSLPAISFGLT
jgi:hypothetical protein